MLGKVPVKLPFKNRVSFGKVMTKSDCDYAYRKGKFRLVGSLAANGLRGRFGGSPK